jgi:hypothetical protein
MISSHLQRHPLSIGGRADARPSTPDTFIDRQSVRLVAASGLNVRIAGRPPYSRHRFARTITVAAQRESP